MVEAGLIARAHPAVDRRRTELAPTAKSEALLAKLTEAHLRELEQLEPAPALGRAGRSDAPP